MKERLKNLRKESGMNQAEFAQWLGVSQSNIASYESGRRTPSEGIIALICQKTGCRIEWLSDGSGEPYPETSREEAIARFVGNVEAKPDSDFQKRFIHTLANLNVQEWEILEKMCLMFVESNKKQDDPEE